MTYPESLGKKNHEPLGRNFIAESGRAHGITITSSERIGSGVIGDIYRVTGYVQSHIVGEAPNTSRPSVFVIKQFNAGAGKTAAERAEHSMQVYAALKEAEVDTWTTYRLEAEHKSSILMTDGELEPGDKVVSSLNPSESAREVNKQVRAISNLDAAIEAAVVSAQRAAAKGIILTPDCWFTRLRLRKDGSAELKLFPGDYDNVLPYSFGKYASLNIRNNLNSIASAFHTMAQQVGISEGNAPIVQQDEEVRTRIEQLLQNQR